MEKKSLNKQSKKLITAAAAVSAAAAFVLCTFLPVLQNADRYLSDLLYQDPSDTGDRIVLVQIDVVGGCCLICHNLEVFISLL